MDSHHEVVPHELDGTLHFSFRLSPIGTAQHGLEPVKPGEVLELAVQGGILLFQQSLDHHLPHVVV